LIRDKLLFDDHIVQFNSTGTLLDGHAVSPQKHQ
jgi:hypothetical protein